MNFTTQRRNVRNALFGGAALVSMFGGMILTASNPVQAQLANAQAKEYSVTAWAEITGCDDGFADNTLEVYGTARVGGNEKWTIERDKAVRKECGNTIQILTNHMISISKFGLRLILMDKDSGFRDDTVGEFNRLVNLDRLIGKTTTFNWGNTNDEASKLYITVK
ncbi:hypothetical protein [Lyngbya aestuarii]|uniref:hypothetical protein n=1 Tax=Lyngbya aestuarii TaxID=118322 RepID=UPI00403E1C4B